MDITAEELNLWQAYFKVADKKQKQENLKHGRK